MIEHNTEIRRPSAFSRFVVAGFAVIALVAAQLMLTAEIHGTNYSGGDGKLAQVTTLTAYKFANVFHFNSINPIQGLGSQLLPMNVWAYSSLPATSWRAASTCRWCSAQSDHNCPSSCLRRSRLCFSCRRSFASW